MSGAREIRQRIAAVGKTRQITSAMQRIAYIRMGRAQQRARQVRPYSQSLFRIVARMLEQHQDHRSPLMAQRVPAHRVGMIVVTTDKGLCGALNTRLLHMCITQMLSWQAAGREVSVTVIGARGLGAMRRAGARIVAQAVGVADLAPDDVTALMGAVAVPLHQFIDGRIDELFVPPTASSTRSASSRCWRASCRSAANWPSCLRCMRARWQCPTCTSRSPAR